MSGHEHLDAPPPELPEEFAAAYQEAYRRALETGGAPGGEAPAGAEVGVTSPPEAVPGPHRRDGGGTDGRPAVAVLVARWRASRWFLPSAVVAGGLVLVAAAYGLGEARGDGPATAPSNAAPVTRTSGPGHPSSSRTAKAKPSGAPGAWSGAVAPVTVAAVSAGCTAPPGTDAAGHLVSYVPENAIDDKAETAWRCPGTAVGQTLTLRLAHSTDVAEVGLVPGYAKTDPVSGVDRYAENNRITRVRWTLDDGRSFEQVLDPAPGHRSLQRMRIPVTTTGTVVLRILAVQDGPRHTTAVSAIEVAGPRS